MPSSANPTATKLARAGCRRWPALPSRTLGRLLFNQNKGVWTSIESARQSIIYHRGRRPGGRGKHGPYCPDPIASTAPRCAWNPEAYLPKSDESVYLPHVVEVDRDTRALVLGDIHLPYHNLPALQAALEQGRKTDCRLVILNGDTLDFHRLSRFQKDPRARNAKEEIARANQLLDAIDELFPRARKIWKDGNHEERFDAYLAAHAEELFQILKENCSLHRLLELESRGWEVVTEKRLIYLGALTVLHGHEYPTPVLGPVNAARGLFLRTKAIALVHHHHQVSQHSEPDVRNNIIKTWSAGCLCDLHPMYARLNKWSHGFAEVELARDGSFQLHNHEIMGGRLLN